MFSKGTPRYGSVGAGCVTRCPRSFNMSPPLPRKNWGPGRVMYRLVPPPNGSVRPLMGTTLCPSLQEFPDLGCMTFCSREGLFSMGSNYWDLIVSSDEATGCPAPILSSYITSVSESNGEPVDLNISTPVKSLGYVLFESTTSVEDMGRKGPLSFIGVLLKSEMARWKMEAR